VLGVASAWATFALLSTLAGLPDDEVGRGRAGDGGIVFTRLKVNGGVAISCSIPRARVREYEVERPARTRADAYRTYRCFLRAPTDDPAVARHCLRSAYGTMESSFLEPAWPRHAELSDAIRRTLRDVTP
jgi:hypothetical protein